MMERAGAHAGAGSESGGAGQEPWGTYAPRPFVAWLRSVAGSRSNGFLARRLAFVARKLAMRLMGEFADVEVFGHRMRIRPHANLAEKRMLFTPQYFDPAERELLARALPADAVFLDIGANVGAYSFYVAQLTGPHARILAVEPQPDIHARLLANVAFNPGVPIEPVALAVADIDGPVQLFVDRANAGGTGMRRIAHSGLDVVTLEVPAKRLSVLVQEAGLPRIDVMKLDVEGAEDLILGPFFREAPRALWPLVLIIDHRPESWQTDCVALARSKGYTLVLETRLNVVLTRAADS